MSSKDIRILLVDDHEIVRNGLRRMLELEEDIKVVGDCADADEAFFQVEMLSPDIVLMDIKMPERDGVETARLLKEKQPACEIIMLTMYDEYLTQAIEAGAVGYLLKDVKRDDLVRAIRAVYHGRLFPNQGLSKFTSSIKDGDGPYLSERELAILRLIANGATTKEIGTQLFLSEATIKRDVQRIFDKLGARNRSEAVAEACKRKIVHVH